MSWHQQVNFLFTVCTADADLTSETHQKFEDSDLYLQQKTGSRPLTQLLGAQKNAYAPLQLTDISFVI